MVVSGSALLEVVVDLSRLSFSAVLCCAVVLLSSVCHVMCACFLDLLALPRGSVRLFDFLLDQIILRQMGAHRGNENLYPPLYFLPSSLMIVCYTLSFTQPTTNATRVFNV